jgi:hypothetical protein
MTARQLFVCLYRIERARGLGRVRSAYIAAREYLRPMPF